VITVHVSMAACTPDGFCFCCIKPLPPRKAGIRKESNKQHAINDVVFKSIQISPVHNNQFDG
jgi:hypothetical protein